MAHRFFLTTPIRDNIATLLDEEAHHALHVMRFGLGDTVVLFDGTGNEHVALIIETGKKQLRLRIAETRITTQSDPRIVIATALPKGDRQKTLIEKGVELGVDELIPLAARRGVSVPNENVIDRMRKSVVEATKQCERTFLMNIRSSLDVQGLIENYRDQNRTLCLLADPHAKKGIAEIELHGLKNVVVAVGPEGGFSPDELELFSNAQWIPVRMGPTILRVETAAIYAGVILSSMRDRLQLQR